MAKRHWTDEEKALVKKCWCKEGLTASQTASKLPGRTRGGVLSLVHRMKWQRRGPAALAGTTRRKRGGKTASLVNLRKPSRAKAAATPVRTGPPIAFEALTARTCRFPVTDTRPYSYCGAAATAPYGYCAAHAKVSRRVDA